MQPAPAKVSFKEQMHQAREHAILRSACDLLGEKSFDAMTMDDVAGKVGIASPTVEEAQQIFRTRALLEVANLPDVLAHEMPLLPSRNSTLRSVLMANKCYADGVIQVSDIIGEWITEAQAEGVIDTDLPPIVVLYTLYARACDPVVSFLKDSALYQDAEIVDLVLRTCFDGMRAR